MDFLNQGSFFSSSSRSSCPRSNVLVAEARWKGFSAIVLSRFQYYPKEIMRITTVAKISLPLLLYARKRTVQLVAANSNPVISNFSLFRNGIGISFYYRRLRTCAISNFFRRCFPWSRVCEIHHREIAGLNCISANKMFCYVVRISVFGRDCLRRVFSDPWSILYWEILTRQF